MLGIFHLLVVLRGQALLLAFGRSYALMLPLHAWHVHIWLVTGEQLQSRVDSLWEAWWCTFTRSRSAADCPRKYTTMEIMSEVVSYPPSRESSTKLTFSSSESSLVVRRTLRKSSFLHEPAFLLSSIMPFTVLDILSLACDHHTREPVLEQYMHTYILDVMNLVGLDVSKELQAG